MPVAVFHRADGIVTHAVKTDGATADSDLALHIAAALKVGLTHLPLDDKTYSSLSARELFATVEAATGKAAVLIAPISAKQSQAAAADLTAFNGALSQGKTFADADLAGKLASKAVTVAVV